MNCKYHQGVEANYACSSCGHPICLQCTVELNKRVYCKECLERHISARPLSEAKPVRAKRKSKFFTFCFSFIPGAGHMYLGLINKGLKLMLVYFSLLFAIIFLSDTIRINWLAGFFIPTTSILFVFYSLFDSLATADEINSGRLVTDSSAVDVDSLIFILKEKVFKNSRVISYSLIILGFLGLINTAIDYFDRFLGNFLRYHLSISISNILLPGILLFLGIYILRRGRNSYM